MVARVARPAVDRRYAHGSFRNRKRVNPLLLFSAVRPGQCDEERCAIQ